MYIITEFAAQGEIFDWLVENKKMTEPQAARTFSQILNAVNYCHLKKVVHRDLKAENLLLDQDGNIKEHQINIDGQVAVDCGSIVGLLHLSAKVVTDCVPSWLTLVFQTTTSPAAGWTPGVALLPTPHRSCSRASSTTGPLQTSGAWALFSTSSSLAHCPSMVRTYRYPDQQLIMKINYPYALFYSHET